VRGAVEIGTGFGDGKYDLTVVGPNRFLRHFTGDAAVSADAVQVRAEYEGLSGERPKLSLRLVNTGRDAVTFTVTHNAYASDRPRTYSVQPHGHVTHEVDAFESAHGWYDLSVTVNSDPSWSRRYVGHLENGEASVTG